ncbi:hypothetical protein Agub_g10765 [Astrephomene gubernaculifera]|uniref:Uncharacterized protein n=1 Tax=Astrephomene gubernaculifera TaxID=47775 RepID=A0AAD3HPY9_9CHLO|nr:hypothetical protein Agub_g10765 [Astrephomene gubernaculifera]
MSRGAIGLRFPSHRRGHQSVTALGRLILASVAVLLLTNPVPASADRWHLATAQRRLQGNSSNTTPGLNATVVNNSTALLNATLVNAPASNVTATNATAAPPPPETAKEKISDKFAKLEAGKTPAERGIAITVGVLMLVCILTCLVCCVFRRGGQWRIPGLQWFKKKFGAKDRYSRYADNNDDGF